MDIGERYLVLALRFRRVAPDLVSSYAGPPELADSVAREPPRTAADLRDAARELRAALGRGGARRRWLDAQLAGVQTACEVLAGERIAYAELVRRCYGISPTFVSDETFAAAHARLDDALAGAGSLRDRYAAWLRTQLVPPDAVLPGIEVLAEGLRARTRETYPLPDGERVEFETVTGKWWGGFADYGGGLCTCVALNTDLPIHGFRLLELAAHEAYPGHHTEHVCKELALGHAELAVYLYPTPQALVAEGLAQLALENVLGDEAEYFGAECLRPLGVAYDAETAAVVRAVKEALVPVRANVATLLDDGDEREARAYARRWMLEPDEQVDRAIRAIRDRAWPAYESCYPEGLTLCRAFVAGRPDGFRRLLTEQLTTADLLA
jgi:hypothetical protein